MSVTRRAAVLLCLAGLPLLAGCGGEEAAPEAFPPLDFSYLTKLQLNVGSIDIDDSWTPAPGSGDHVEYLAPVQPVDALAQMARQRLVAAGNAGQARFVVEDASIVRSEDRLDGSLAVRLEVTGPNGAPGGFAEARVARSQPDSGDDADSGRAVAYQLVKRMMDDMNVEFEYQLRHSLGAELQSTRPAAPPPSPVQQQLLAPPPGTMAAPPPPGS